MSSTIANRVVSQEVALSGEPGAAQEKPAEAREEEAASLGRGSRDSASGQKMNLLLDLVTPEALQFIPPDTARKWTVIPLKVNDGSLQVAMADIADIMAVQALTVMTGMRIEVLPASAADIREAIDRSYDSYHHIAEQFGQFGPEPLPAEKQNRAQSMIEVDEEAPVAQALDLLLEEGVKKRASDIQIEPQETQVRVRYRIDGSLHEVISMPKAIHPVLVSRVKVLANMNIADSRRPQDGQFSAAVGEKQIDIRVGTANTVHGEMVVLRLLDKSVAVLPLERLGMNPETQKLYEGLIGAPWGMFLVSGPTGAGKTSTLYATVNNLDKVGRHIITIEDPVEYRFQGINQIQVNVKAGLTFATGLRAILRLAPDVILVGEIRDGETANIATQSALTGHLVLSSVHANDAVGVLFRLLDLGVEPFLVCASVFGIVAQRLIRRLCPHCAILAPAPLVEQLAYQRETGEVRTRFLSGTGCKSCAHTGYQGRTGIFEMLRMTDEIRRLLMAGAPAAEIRAQAIKDGMVPLARDGMLKVKAGLTTPRDVMRSTFSTEVIP